MSDDSKQEDGKTITDSLSRRRVLALSSSGLLGSIAGCSGDGGSSTPTATDTPTDTATPTPTDTPTATPEPTPTEREKSIEELIAEYNCPDLEADPDIVVAKDGSGDYESVQAAIDAIPAGDFQGTLVYIKNGRYKEKLELPSNRTDVTFVGEDPEETVLTYDDHANKTDDSGDEIGTSGSSSFFVWGPDFTAKNITFENAADPVAQAVAIRIDADRAVFENCRFIGNQDTLYNYGDGSRQYFKDCYIEGDTDFIFGGGIVFLENCEVFSVDSGYVCAPGTPESQEYGYVFKNCELTGDAPDDSVYLGRPWQPYGQTVFMNTTMGDHIRPVGWEPWDEEGHVDKRETSFLAEYNNEGPGYTPDQRADWSHQLTEEEAAEYTIENVFDGWNPKECL